MAEQDSTELKIGDLDSTGAKCTAIYARHRYRYVVYATMQRMVVCFADDPELERLQRRRLVAISDLRGEIASLLTSLAARDFGRRWWQFGAATDEGPASPSVASWHEQVAEGIKDALEGYPDQARITLARVRDEILAERQSRGRLVYLRVAALAVIAVAVVALVASLPGTVALTGSSEAVAVNLWRAIAAGALGAFFSIARSITGRTVRADSRVSDYTVDALTRIAVGCIAALVLEALLDSGLFSIKLAGVDMIGRAPGATRLTVWPITVVAGFLAGFSERLVPDLMATYAVGAAAPPPPPPPPSPSSPPLVAAPKAAAADAPAHADLAPLADDPHGVDAPAEPDPDDHTDGCDADLDDPAEATRDADLPAASGGVAKG